jgi:hypothetical protein
VPGQANVQEQAHPTAQSRNDQGQHGSEYVSVARPAKYAGLAQDARDHRAAYRYNEYEANQAQQAYQDTRYPVDYGRNGFPIPQKSGLFHKIAIGKLSVQDPVQCELLFIYFVDCVLNYTKHDGKGQTEEMALMHSHGIAQVVWGTRPS